MLSIKNCGVRNTEPEAKNVCGCDIPRKNTPDDSYGMFESTPGKGDREFKAISSILKTYANSDLNGSRVTVYEAGLSDGSSASKTIIYILIWPKYCVILFFKCPSENCIIQLYLNVSQNLLATAKLLTIYLFII